MYSGHRRNVEGVKTKRWEKVSQTCVQEEKEKLAGHLPITSLTVFCTGIYRKEEKGHFLEIWDRSLANHADGNWKPLYIPCRIYVYLGLYMLYKITVIKIQGFIGWWKIWESKY